MNVSTNFSHSPNQSFERCDPYVAVESTTNQALMTSGFALLLFGSLVGNALVIAVFYKRYDQLRTPVNYFIVSMAASDLLVPVFIIPRRIKHVYFGWYPWLVGGVLGDILCRLLHFADEVSMTVSSQSMVFIAAERFWAIVFPMKPPLISRKSCPRFICFTWLFSMTFYSYYFVVNKLVQKDKVYTCVYTLPQIFDNWEDLWRIDRLSLLVVFVIIPLVLLVTFYTAIVVTLHRQEKAASHLSSEVQQQRNMENRRVTKMLIAVVVLFFISWTPYYGYFFLQYFHHFKLSCNFMKGLYLCVLYLNYIYTAINPLIYYMFNSTYRQGFHDILRCSRSRFQSNRQGNADINKNQQKVRCQDDSSNDLGEVGLRVISENHT